MLPISSVMIGCMNHAHCTCDHHIRLYALLLRIAHIDVREIACKIYVDAWRKRLEEEDFLPVRLP
jgi:hypothetical protein